jgi:sugar/nucleoside kinase (ribokinase family)
MSDDTLRRDFGFGMQNMTEKVDLLGISNAIVDILAHVDDAFLASVGAPPGSMTLIDQDRAREIYDRMGPATEMSGGSVANTVAGFANLGGSAAYIGRVHDDQLGEIFVHDMRSLGVDVRTPPASRGSPTARSHILISEDGQRTMQTYLGACTELAASDISAATVGKPKVVLLEGYVWDIPEGPQLLADAIRLGQEGGAAIALSLSDSFCVDRHRAEFLQAVRNDVDIVLADEDEVIALFESTDFDSMLGDLDGLDCLFAITRSAKGSVIVHEREKVVQPATPVDKVVDSTGAGDAWSAGFLYGWTHGMSLQESARLGTYCATSVIQQVGARLEKGLLNRFLES